jgi:hypothetical protein
MASVEQRKLQSKEIHNFCSVTSVIISDQYNKDSDPRCKNKREKYIQTFNRKNLKTQTTLE